MVSARSLLPTGTPILSSYQLEALCLVLSMSESWRARERFLWPLLTSPLTDTPKPPEYLLIFIHIFPVLSSASQGLSNVQFGSIEDNSASRSTSSAAPSTLTDQMQVRTFGSISPTPKPPTASPAVSLPGSSSTAASSAGPIVKKIDIHKLFKPPSGASSEPIPGQVPHTMGEQGIPPSMMQWHHASVSSITVKLLLIHPPLPSRPNVPPSYWRPNHCLTSRHILQLHSNLRCSFILCPPLLPSLKCQYSHALLLPKASIASTLHHTHVL